MEIQIGSSLSNLNMALSTWINISTNIELGVDLLQWRSISESAYIGGYRNADLDESASVHFHVLCPNPPHTEMVRNQIIRVLIFNKHPWKTVPVNLCYPKQFPQRPGKIISLHIETHQNFTVCLHGYLCFWGLYFTLELKYSPAWYLRTLSWKFYISIEATLNNVIQNIFSHVPG